MPKQFLDSYLYNLRNWSSISDEDVLKTKKYIRTLIINSNIHFSTLSVEKAGYYFFIVNFHMEGHINATKLLVDSLNNKYQLVEFTGKYKDERDLFSIEFPNIPEIIQRHNPAYDQKTAMSQVESLVGYNIRSISWYKTNTGRLFIYGGCSDGEVRIWDYQTGFSIGDGVCYGTDQITCLLRYEDESGQQHMLMGNSVGNLTDYLLEIDGRLDYMNSKTNYILEGFNDRTGSPMCPPVLKIHLFENNTLLAISMGNLNIFNKFDNENYTNSEYYNHTNSNKIILYSVPTQKILKTLDYHKNEPIIGMNIINSSIISCDSSGQIYQYNVEKQLTQRYTVDHVLTSSCVFRQKLLLGTNTNDILVYDFSDMGQLIDSWTHDENSHSIETEIHPISELIASNDFVVSVAGKTVKIWGIETHTHNCLQANYDHSQKIECVHVIENLGILTSQIGTIQLWRVNRN